MAKHVFVLRGGRWQPLPRPAHAVSISSSLAAITIWQNVFVQIANVFVQITKSIWSDSKMYLSKWPNVFVQISKWHWWLYWGKSPGLRLKERSLRKILEVPAVPYGGTKRGKRWGSWVWRGAQGGMGGPRRLVAEFTKGPPARLGHNLDHTRQAWRSHRLLGNIWGRNSIF